MFMLTTMEAINQDPHHVGNCLFVNREQLAEVIIFVVFSKYLLYNWGLKLSINIYQCYLPNVEGTKDE